MKEIPLTRGKTAIVSDEDFTRVSANRWYLAQDGYAERQIIIDGKKHNIRMHHFIIGKPPIGKIVDHINGNRTDNRRKNLRFITRQQNQFNRQTDRGVTFSNKKWSAYIHINRKKIHLGSFLTKEDALKKRKEAEKKYFFYD